MKIISWNVRGLGMPSKLYLVKDFLLLNHVDIYCIQESKLSLVDNSICRSIGGTRLDHYSYIPALGSAGGMIVGWNNILFEGHKIYQGTFCLSIEFKNKSSDFST
ncbi:DNase I-like protein, partial [Dioscorea alata]